MALKNRSDQKVAYAKIKEGKFYLATDKDYKNPFDSVEGTIVDLFLKDETYEGKPNRKLYVAISDGDEKTLIGFSFDSAYTTTLISFLKNADLSKPLEISPVEKVEIVNGIEKKKRSLLVSQNGSFMKSYFTRNEPNGLPEMRKIKFNGKDVWDKTEFLQFFENTISDLKNSLGSNSTSYIPKSESVTYKNQDNQKEEASLPWNTEDSDDLPF